MKSYLYKLGQKITFSRFIFVRAFVLSAMLIFLAGNLWGDEIWSGDKTGEISVTDGNTITLISNVKINGGYLTISGTVTINLGKYTLTCQGLVLGGATNTGGTETYLTVTSSSTATLTTGYYDVANDANTTLYIDSEVTVAFTGNYYLNTDGTYKTSVTGPGAFDTSSGSQVEGYVRDTSTIITLNDTYYWTGNGNGTNWNDTSNWSASNTETTIPTYYPGEHGSSTVIFNTDTAVTLENVGVANTTYNITIKNKSSNSVTISTVGSGGLGSITISEGKLAASCNLALSGTFTLASGTNFETTGSISTGNYAITNNGTLTSSGETSTSGCIYNNGTFNAGGNISAAYFKSGTASSAAAGTLEIIGNVSLSISNSDSSSSWLNDLIIDDGKRLTLASDIIVYGNWTNNNASAGGLSAGGKTVTFAGSGKTVSGSQTFGNVNVSGASTFSGANTFGDVNVAAAAIFSEANTFTSFSCTTSGISLTFGAGKSQTINGAFTITGAALQSSTEGSQWKLSVPIANASITGATVTDSYSENDSIPADASTDNGNNTNWDFGNQEYIWTGASGKNWKTAANWSPKSIPGKSAAAIIPGGLAQYPVLSDAITVKNLTIGSSADKSAKITISDTNNLTVTSDGFTNYGTVNYVSSGRIVNSSSTAINDLENEGTVEYSGNSQTITDYGDTDYANLVISGSASIGTDKALNVSKALIIEGSGSLTGNNADITAAGKITNKGTLDLSSKAITINAGGDWENTGSFTCGNSSVRFTGANATISGDNTFYMANFSGAGASLSGSNTFTRADFKANTTLAAANTFDNFNCTTPGVILSFAGGLNQTITTGVTITGNSSSPIILKSTASGSQWTITSPATSSSTSTVSYASISDSASTNAYISAINSTDSGNNTRWNFVGNSYTWAGGTSGDWTASANWSPASAPGPDSKATIPGGCTYYPDISSAGIEITELSLSSASSKITLSTTDNLTVSGAFTNFGTIYYSSSGRIVNSSSTAINDVSNKGTVSYSGGTSGSPLTVTEYGETDYANLEISGGFAKTSSALLVSGTFNGTGGSLEGDSNVIEFKDAVTFGSFTANGSKVKLSGSSNQTLTTNSQTFQDIHFATSGTVTVNGNLISEGTITNDSSAGLTVNGSINVKASGAIENNSAAGLSVSSDITAENNTTITNSTSCTISVAGSFTANTGSTIINNGSIKLTSTASSNKMSFATYSGSGDSIETAGAGITSNAPSATRLTSLTFTGSTQITNSGSGKLTIERLTGSSGKTAVLAGEGGEIIITKGTWNTSSLSTSGTVTIPESTADNPLGSLTVTGGSLTANSTVTAESITTAAGALLTAGTSITTSGDVTNNGSINTGSATSTISGELTNAGNWIAGSGSISVTGNITNSGSLTVTSATINAGANWANTGIFSCGTGTVNFTGVSATISGDNTFYMANFSGTGASLTGSNTFTTANFTANTTLAAENTFDNFNCTTPGLILSFADGLTQTIATDGSFTVTGNSDNPVILTSISQADNETDWWRLDVKTPANASVNYAKICSSYAENDISGCVFYSSELIEGTTDGWFNPYGYFYWTGGSSSDWTDRTNWSVKRDRVRPPAVPPVITDGSATIFHISDSGANQLDFTQISSDIVLNNLIIESDAALAKDIKANYLLFKAGTIEINADITASKDLIILGSAYSTSDHQTGIADIYAYPGDSSLMVSEETVSSSTDYSALLYCQSGARLSCRNFYANGITARSNGEWTLSIASNFNSDDSFAQAFFSDFSQSACLVTCNNSNEEGVLAIMAEECSLMDGYTENWDYEDFIITEACTVDDEIIKVSFNRSIRNSSSIINNGIANIVVTDNENSALGIYTDFNCSKALPDTDSAADFYSEIYLKSPESWNTDATGSSAGSGKNKCGVKKSIIPLIKIDRNTESSDHFITDLYGKRLRHYKGGSYPPYTEVKDQCGPVLLYVLTGQDLHSEYDSSTGASSQHTYDAHNFLEFRYSEEISVSQWASGESENLVVSDSLGTVSSMTGEENLTLAGLCKIEGGRLHTGSAGSDNKYVNTFYIPDSSDMSVIRLSIAALTEGTINDRDGNPHWNWTAYIESAIQPWGIVSFTDDVDTGAIKDKAGNIQSAPKAEITVDSTENGLYGKWDLTEPAFAPLRLEASSEWAEGSFNEALGNSLSGELYINEIEFHLFDNKPSYSQNDEAAWHTERGWIYNNSSDTLYTDYSYAADIIGGARGFDSDSSRRTGGGIRYSSLADAVSAFKYTPSQLSGATPDLSFQDTLPYKGAKGTLFTGSSETRRAADRHDGLYFGLEIESQKYTFADSFTVSYDDTKGFVTDLAGNRLRSATVKTIDRTPPSYDITISPVNQKEVCLVFNKNIATDSSKIKYYDSDGKKVQIQESFASLIPSCFEIITIDSTGSAVKKGSLQPDTSVPAKIQHISSDSESGQEFTIITLTMEENISYDDIKNCFIRIKYPNAYGEFSTDPITGIENARVTFIQDEIGNYMNMYEAHALSEFAVNVIEAQYAYTSDSQPDIGWSVHDWNADQQSFGTLPLNHDYDIVASTAEGVEGALLCFATSPDQASLSTKINSDLNLSYRIWLPALGGFSLPAFTFTPSQEGSYKSVSALQKENQLIHTIPSDMTSEIAAGSQVLFLYALTDSSGSPLTICNIPEYDFSTGLYDVTSSNRIPLFALRQLDFSDLLSLDLWSFRLKGLTLQRGGITIFNNVINVSNGESLTLQVDMAEEGRLNVMVMTLDGNIIEYLSHGNVSAGSHHFTWDGKNRRGSPVARGLYFIRVTGSGIDETRKVMVVR